MIVLKATQEQYEAIDGFTNGLSTLRFIKDDLNNWIVGAGVLNDNAFIDIKEYLQELEQVEIVNE